MASKQYWIARDEYVDGMCVLDDKIVATWDHQTLADVGGYYRLEGPFTSISGVKRASRLRVQKHAKALMHMRQRTRVLTAPEVAVLERYEDEVRATVYGV
jgi:hypothetical protein